MKIISCYLTGFYNLYDCFFFFFFCNTPLWLLYHQIIRPMLSVGNTNKRPNLPVNSALHSYYKSSTYPSIYIIYLRERERALKMFLTKTKTTKDIEQQCSEKCSMCVWVFATVSSSYR